VAVASAVKLRSGETIAAAPPQNLEAFIAKLGEDTREIGNDQRIEFWQNSPFQKRNIPAHGGDSREKGAESRHFLRELRKGGVEARNRRIAEVSFAGQLRTEILDFTVADKRKLLQGSNAEAQIGRLEGGGGFQGGGMCELGEFPGEISETKFVT
jgi:hypothetical protein